MPKTTFKEMMNKQQEGIDCIVAANCFREGTKNHKTNYERGIQLLTEVRDFFIEVNAAVGNWTVE